MGTNKSLARGEATAEGVLRWLDARRKSVVGGCGGKSVRRRGGSFVELSLSTRTQQAHTVLEVGGEIDVYTAPQLRERLIELVEGGKAHIVVDMEQVEFLDSTGLGVLVGGLKRVRAHDGSLALVCAQERILKIFRITGLEKVFGIFPTVEEAVAASG
jgi:anti-sigma B factor antagonist